MDQQGRSPSLPLEALLRGARCMVTRAYTAVYLGAAVDSPNNDTYETY
eukprot:SAG31_NODE_9011_length_1348_cov_1.725380_2_plen_48_part_00